MYLRSTSISVTSLKNAQATTRLEALVTLILQRIETDMVKLALDKGMIKAQICRDLEISKTSLYRIIGDLND